MTMTLIETKTLGTAAASIEFTSIPQDGTDLVVKVSSRIDTTTFFALISFNGSTANFTSRRLHGDGSASSASYTTGRVLWTSGSTDTSNTFGNADIYIPNYAGATNKSYSCDSVSENNSTTAYQNLMAGLWSQTAAITSLAITANSGNFVAGSTISLYKITKGTDGIVVTS
jgi:hypothetical protein